VHYYFQWCLFYRYQNWNQCTLVCQNRRRNRKVWILVLYTKQNPKKTQPPPPKQNRVRSIEFCYIYFQSYWVKGYTDQEQQHQQNYNIVLYQHNYNIVLYQQNYNIVLYQQNYNIVLYQQNYTYVIVKVITETYPSSSRVPSRLSFKTNNNVLWWLCTKKYKNARKLNHLH
jgi:hypothetical protein